MSEVPRLFVGARLTQAREVFGLSVESLGDMLGVSRQAVDQFEKGDHPSTEHFIKLCTVLNKPGSYFYKPIAANYRKKTVFFRKLKKVYKIEVKSAESTIEWVGDICRALDEDVNFPDLNLPHFTADNDDIIHLANNQIDEFAYNLRQQWGLGVLPINNLVSSMEENGIIVVRMNLHSHDIDGLSIFDYDLGRPIVILNADKSSAARSRFDAAHEIGHMVMHRDISQEEFAANYDVLEKQAHYFASSFLLPADAFVKNIFTASLFELKAMKQIWRVSIAAMIVRLQGLGILEKDPSKKIWANYNRRGWKKQEPFDDVWAPEAPNLIKDALELISEENLYSKNQLLELLIPDESAMSNITMLPVEFFRPVKNMRLKLA